MSQRISNRQIVDELKKGERQGCTHLMREYQHKLFHYLVHTLNLSREDAEEIVSDALLSAVQRISYFSFRESDADFGRWIFTILKNKVRDFWKHQSRCGLAMETFAGLDRSDGEEEQIDREVIQCIVRDFIDGECSNGECESRPLQLVAETLQSMESWERVLLRCRALDIPYEDIAHYVDKSAKQLKVYHFRIKQKFAGKLRKAFEERHVPLRTEKS